MLAAAVSASSLGYILNEDAGLMLKKSNLGFKLKAVLNEDEDRRFEVAKLSKNKTIIRLTQQQHPGQDGLYVPRHAGQTGGADHRSPSPPSLQMAPAPFFQYHPPPLPPQAAPLHPAGPAALAREPARPLRLESPAVQSLSFCLLDDFRVSSDVRFEMRFQDMEKGAGVSYSLAGGRTEDEERGKDGEREPPIVELDADVDELLSCLPDSIVSSLEGPWRYRGRDALIEVALDEARPIVMRKREGGKVVLRHLHMVDIPSILSHLAAKVNKPESRLFGSDGRLALPGSLHRISRIQDPRTGHIQGLTMRVGRFIGGIASIFADVLAEMVVTRGGVLLVGAPGLGKTTLLRDIVHTLSGTFQQSVGVVDTSNEIAGDGTPPHPCIGDARRLMVGERDKQSSVMLEAVQNHTPECIIIDEISNRREVDSVRTIAARGVSMVATAHGADLSSLLSNPDLVPLLGGIETVILGDKAAARDDRGDGKKTRAERKGKPVFGVLIEVVSQGEWRLHRDVAASVDSMLSGGYGHAERRKYAAFSHPADYDQDMAGTGYGLPPASASSQLKKAMSVSFESRNAVELAAAAAVMGPEGRRVGGGVRSHAAAMGGG